MGDIIYFSENLILKDLKKIEEALESIEILRMNGRNISRAVENDLIYIKESLNKKLQFVRGDK
jgi:DNA-binding protein